MELREVNLGYHYSERLKANFFLVTPVVGKLTELKGERLEGGKEVAKALLRALRGELNIAKRYLPATETNFIERRVLEAEGEIEFYNYEKVRERLAEAISSVATLSDKYMGLLQKENLV